MFHDIYNAWAGLCRLNNKYLFWMLDNTFKYLVSE